MYSWACVIAVRHHLLEPGVSRPNRKLPFELKAQLFVPHTSAKSPLRLPLPSSLTSVTILYAGWRAA